jgi:hypothetical protein
MLTPGGPAGERAKMAGSATVTCRSDISSDSLEVGGGCHGNDAAADDSCVCVGEVYVGEAFEWVGWKEVGVVMARVPEYEEMLRVVMLGLQE